MEFFENTPQTGEIWKRWLCVFVRTENILKTELFENDYLTFRDNQDRWIKRLKTHLYSVSLDLKKNNALIVSSYTSSLLCRYFVNNLLRTDTDIERVRLNAFYSALSVEDDFQSVLRSLSTLMFLDIISSHSMECESTLFVTNHLRYLWGISNSFFQQLHQLIFTTAKLFHKWYEKEQSISFDRFTSIMAVVLRLWIYFMSVVAKCNYFVMSYIRQNKKNANELEFIGPFVTVECEPFYQPSWKGNPLH